MICHTQLIEDELYDKFSKEVDSYRRFEYLYNSTLSLYHFLKLVEAGYLTELGIGYPSGLYMFHFDMNNTKGHIIVSPIGPFDLLMLHFYLRKTDLVPKQRANEARRRLDNYWGKNIT